MGFGEQGIHCIARSQFKAGAGRTNVLASTVLLTNPATTALNDLEPGADCALFAAGAEFDLLSGRSVCGDSVVSGDHGERDPARRKRMARKGAITCFIVLTSFAIAGQTDLQDVRDHAAGI